MFFRLCLFFGWRLISWNEVWRNSISDLYPSPFSRWRGPFSSKLHQACVLFGFLIALTALSLLIACAFSPLLPYVWPTPPLVFIFAYHPLFTTSLTLLASILAQGVATVLPSTFPLPTSFLLPIFPTQVYVFLILPTLSIPFPIVFSRSH